MTLGRFSEIGLLVMVGLSDGPKHGYALMDEVEALRGSRPGPGTLYGAMTRLEQLGWIEALPGASRRRPYRLTKAGAAALAEQLSSLEKVVETARARLSGT